jgi:hypothetical protein
MIAVMLISGLTLLVAICVADLIAPSPRTTSLGNTLPARLRSEISAGGSLLLEAFPVRSPSRIAHRGKVAGSAGNCVYLALLGRARSVACRRLGRMFGALVS